MLKNLLLNKKEQILQRWSDLIIETYPNDGATFLRRNKGQFTNPVGHAISIGIDALYDELIQDIESSLGEMASERICRHLQDIVKIRAVQEFSPSAAISFVVLLKQAIQEALESETTRGELCGELIALFSRIDELMLLAFDMYMERREKIYEIRISGSRVTSFGRL